VLSSKSLSPTEALRFLFSAARQISFPQRSNSDVPNCDLKSDVQTSNAFGASILATDYDNVNSIVKQLETNDVDTVISTLGSTFGTDSGITIIKAAESSKKTTRYIPSIGGIPCSPE
jgi:hypothetical protein